MKRSAGFTLLEVMVALFIAALLAVMVSGVLRQRIDGHLAVREHQQGALCARELLARFEVERYWPERDEVSGELRQGPMLCRWQMTLGYTGVRNLRRGEMRLFGEDGRGMGQFSVFLSRP